MKKKKWFNLQDPGTLGLTLFCLHGGPVWQVLSTWVNDGVIPWVAIGAYAFFAFIVIPLHWIFRNNP